MKNLFRWAAALLCCAVLAACTSYPLGMAEAEWLRLTPEQQLQAREKQLEVDRLSEQRRLVEAAARQEEAQRQAAELQARRQDARYGERLQCVLQPAQAWLDRQWRPVEPLGSMPFCVELDNLKDTDAPIHQPAAMLVAAD